MFDLGEPAWIVDQPLKRLTRFVDLLKVNAFRPAVAVGMDIAVPLPRPERRCQAGDVRENSVHLGDVAFSQHVFEDQVSVQVEHVLLA